MFWLADSNRFHCRFCYLLLFRLRQIGRIYRQDFVKFHLPRLCRFHFRLCDLLHFQPYRIGRICRQGFFLFHRPRFRLSSDFVFLSPLSNF